MPNRAISIKHDDPQRKHLPWQVPISNEIKSSNLRSWLGYSTWCIKYNKTNSASSTVSLLQMKWYHMHWHQDLPFFSDRCRSLGSYFKWSIQSSCVTKSETLYSDLCALFQIIPLICCSGCENTDKRFLLHHNHNHNQNDHGQIKGLHFTSSSLCARVTIKHDPLPQNNVDTYQL